MKKQDRHKKLVRESYVVMENGARALLIPGGSEALKKKLLSGLAALDREEREKCKNK